MSVAVDIREKYASWTDILYVHKTVLNFCPNQEKFLIHITYNKYGYLNIGKNVL